MRIMWTYSDGTLTVKGYWWPGGAAGAGSWVLVDPVTGNVKGVVPAGTAYTTLEVKVNMVRAVTMKMISPTINGEAAAML